jgi:hypothetical protein
MSKPKNIYLVAQYMMKPQPHVNTSKKGWMDNPENIRYDEQVVFTRGLRTKDMNAQVILDLSNKQVERNTFKTDKSFDDIFRYFLENYTDYVAQTMAQIDPEYLSSVAKTLSNEMIGAHPELAAQPTNNTIQEAVINEETQAQ